LKIGRIHKVNKVIAQSILLGLPTMALVGWFIYTGNNYYSILENNFISQTIYFSVGLMGAFIFYAYKFRFVTTTIVLALLLSSIYAGIKNIATGEFDAFFASVHFLIFSILFLIGWITGYGFSRSKIYTIFWTLFLCACQMILVSKTSDIKATAIITAFIPVLFYTFYIIYASALIRNAQDSIHGLTWYFSKRITGFFSLLLLLFIALFYLFQPEFKAIEKEWGGGQSNEGEKGGGSSKQQSMTHENEDGSVSNNNSMSLGGTLGKNKKLVFVAHLDNFFPDSITPNPLYFTSDYYTKFDTAIQAFEIDSLMPDNDLFKPNPSKIPLYFAKTDTSVITHSMASLDRQVVNAEVYKVLLSPDVFIAPATAFFCQPIGVPPEFKEQYKSAYRAKMWVSRLNSAYFIYNPAGNQALEDFQEERFQQLRSITNYNHIDKNFLSYYTSMPSNSDYDSIRILAREITAHAQSPIDKIIAIRDYFLSKDEFGQPLFAYADNAGIPGLPSASKLNYFLFSSHKGYCAYYAGATLFMLRALGIPSRVSAGFITINRSNKNPGWYWFYEDQAHAWVQVFFPGYGWLDFDTTIPDVNTIQSPQPDGTPPLNLQQPYFVADGKIISVDTLHKMINLAVNKLLFHDENFTSSIPVNVKLNIALASISRDTGIVTIQSLKENMHITAASYAESLKNILAQKGDSMASVIKKIIQPVPVDEIKIIDDVMQKNQKQQSNQEEKSFNKRQLIKILGVLALLLVLLILFFPFIIWFFFDMQARTAPPGNRKAFLINRSLHFYFNQFGYSRRGMSPYEFALSIDRQFGTKIITFSDLYQKMKYSNQESTLEENEWLRPFYESTKKIMKEKFSLSKRINAFLKLNRTFLFFKNIKTIHYE